MIFGWPTFKIMCNTPIFYFNFRCQIENQVSDYRLLGASNFFVYIMDLGTWWTNCLHLCPLPFTLLSRQWTVIYCTLLSRQWTVWFIAPCCPYSIQCDLLHIDILAMYSVINVPCCPCIIWFDLLCLAVNVSYGLTYCALLSMYHMVWLIVPCCQCSEHCCPFCWLSWHSKFNNYVEKIIMNEFHSAPYVCMCEKSVKIIKYGTWWFKKQQH
jgi:hypothetical protein